MAPALITRTVPKRSAIAPASGWPMPHNRFWIASASANTSRPQPFASDQGLRKNPSEERGPKVRTAIRQPQITITVGVRHARRAAVFGYEAAVIGFGVVCV